MLKGYSVSIEAYCSYCCKDDPSAKNPQPIMDSINNGLQKIRSQTLYQKEKQKVRCWMYKKISTNCEFSSSSPIAVKW